MHTAEAGPIRSDGQYLKYVIGSLVVVNAPHQRKPAAAAHGNRRSFPECSAGASVTIKSRADDDFIEHRR